MEKREVTYGYAYDPEDGWGIEKNGSIWINDIERETNEIATHWMALPECTYDD